MSKGLCEENTFDILHKYSEKELADIIYEFGEESFSRKIPKAIKINLNNLKSKEVQAQPEMNSMNYAKTNTKYPRINTRWSRSFINNTFFCSFFKRTILYGLCLWYLYIFHRFSNDYIKREKIRRK